MIQINLLPDVKRDFLRKQRFKRLFGVMAFFVCAIAITILVALTGYVYVVQNPHVSNVQDDIDTGLNTLQNIEDLDKILTVQNQLQALPGLHDDKLISSRLFDYLSVLVPERVALNAFELASDDSRILVKGAGDDFKAINVFADTLKNAEFITADDAEGVRAFKNVVLDTIGQGDDSASFTIEMEYDEVIFSATADEPKMRVPNIISTRSSTESPKALFEPAPADTGGAQ